MFSRRFWTAVFVSAAISAALAQDPTKVEPTHYKLDFENEHVRVVHIHYGPHETSVMHEHAAGVVVYVTDAHFRFTNANGEVQEAYGKAGEARWFPAFKHEAENLSNKPFEGVYIVVKH